jgi:hypothetical protein
MHMAHDIGGLVFRCHDSGNVDFIVVAQITRVLGKHPRGYIQAFGDFDEPIIDIA